MPRKPKSKVDIDVVPYLSIMVIVLKLICLILIVTVMRLALNPFQKKVVSFDQMYQTSELLLKKRHQIPKIPSYVECRAGSITVYPGSEDVRLSDLAVPGNVLDKMLDRVAANATNEYVIVLLRPNSVPTYRYIRRVIARRGLDVGYDVVDAETVIDWKKAAKNLNIQLDEPKK